MIYKVAILTRASKTVDVIAESREEAEAIVRQEYIDGRHDDLDGHVNVEAFGVIEDGIYKSVI